jgi:isoleucyl-tRNA synthetase
LIKSARKEMNEYKLYAVVPKLVKFLDNLTNWYVRLNRNRIKGELSLEEM